MAKAQCLVFILRHKGLKSFKFGSVHWLKSWMCSFSTGLAQNNRAASWPSTFLLYQPGLDSGCSSAKLDHSIPQSYQSVRQTVTVQNLPGCTVFPGFAPSLFFPTSCHRFLYIFQTCVPASGFDPPCKMLPQHFNLSWTASTTLNLCDTEAALPALWRRIANHSALFHYTFHHEMSNPPTRLFFLTRSFSNVGSWFISFRLHTPKGEHLQQH